MKKFFKEFKEFATKGNVMDLAIAVIIGGAFAKIVSSLVADIMTPLIGLLLGGTDFNNLMIEVGESKIMYGLFLQNVFDFIVIALVIFTLIKVMSRFKKKEETKQEVVMSNEEKLLTEIRDLLKNKK